MKALLLLQRLRSEGNPLIDGDQATFVWEGESAPLLRGDFNQWTADSIHFQAVEPGIWTYSITLPRDAYLEYAFADPAHPDPLSAKARLRDPHNQRLVWNGFSAYNHFFDMPDAKHTPLIHRARGVPRGTVSKLTLENSWLFPKGKRRLWLYAPHDQSERVPLLVVWDGQDYVQRGRIVEIVDNLIAQKRIPPLAMALIESSRRARYLEYNAGEAALEVLTNLVLPAANKHLNLIDTDQKPGAYAILGASMGGLMALYAGLRLPGIFGKVISQAGAFVYRPLPGQDIWIHTLVRLLPTSPLKIWQDVGTLDFLLDSNRQMHPILVEKGFEVTYREYSAAHNYTAWRDALPDALATVLG